MWAVRLVDMEMATASSSWMTGRPKLQTTPGRVAAPRAGEQAVVGLAGRRAVVAARVVAGPLAPEVAEPQAAALVVLVVVLPAAERVAVLVAVLIAPLVAILVAARTVGRGVLPAAGELGVDMGTQVVEDVAFAPIVVNAAGSAVIAQ